MRSYLCYLSVICLTMMIRCLYNPSFLENHDNPPKQTSTPVPPIPAIKHWNPHVSNSVVTFSTTVVDSTDQHGQGNKMNTAVGSRGNVNKVNSSANSWLMSSCW